MAVLTVDHLSGVLQQVGREVQRRVAIHARGGGENPQLTFELPDEHNRASCWQPYSLTGSELVGHQALQLASLRFDIGCSVHPYRRRGDQEHWRIQIESLDSPAQRHLLTIVLDGTSRGELLFDGCLLERLPQDRRKHSSGHLPRAGLLGRLQQWWEGFGRVKRLDLSSQQTAAIRDILLTGNKMEDRQ